MARPVAVLAGLALACARPAPPAATDPVTITDGTFAMGTVLEVTLVVPERAAGEALRDRLFAEAARLDALLTLYDPASPLVAFNARAGQGPQEVDPELARLLARSLALSAATAGAFDVTVGPLVALWREAGVRGRAPSAAERARARARSGPSKLRVELPARAELTRAGAAVDLGGVAKGWALDRMAEHVRAAGVASALLSFGQSSLWALGAPPGETGWRLLVRSPDGGFAGVATLRDRAVSVSGSLGQWTEIEGRRHGHVIDPRSGEPLRRPALAVVLAADATTAEALSKALLVLAPGEALAVLAAQPRCEGLLVEAEGRRIETPGWASASRFEAAPLVE